MNFHLETGIHVGGEGDEPLEPEEGSWGAALTGGERMGCSKKEPCLRKERESSPAHAKNKSSKIIKVFREGGGKDSTSRGNSTPTVRDNCKKVSTNAKFAPRDEKDSGEG